jgi:cyclopropane fatty-acyl-phospholipid synthase-like methyltransferase
MNLFRGVHYKNWTIYKLITLLKLRGEYNYRYKLASKYIKNGETVLDICAGGGDLKKYLPKQCDYTTIEKSDNFSKILAKKNIENMKINLHEDFTFVYKKYDVVIMLISLCHFRNTSVSMLLEKFKLMGDRVIIIEEVLRKKRESTSCVYQIINYLCATEYYMPIDLFTDEEFKKVIELNDYEYIKSTDRYRIGLYQS